MKQGYECAKLTVTFKHGVDMYLSRAVTAENGKGYCTSSRTWLPFALYLVGDSLVLFSKIVEIQIHAVLV